jgi:hypothetical protein
MLLTEQDYSIWITKYNEKYEKLVSSTFFWKHPIPVDYLDNMMLSGNFNGMLQARLEYLWDNRFLEDAREFVDDVFFSNPMPYWVNMRWLFRPYDDWLYARSERNKQVRGILYALLHEKILRLPRDVCNVIFDTYYIPLK